MHIVKNSRILNNMNCWKIKLDNTIFAIMPAHVATIKINGIWKSSSFLNACDKITKTDWFVPDNWQNNIDIYNDFCWTELKQDTDHYLEPTKLNLNDPVDGNFYFHQPFSYTGKLTNVSSFGKIKSSLYLSPNSNMLESINIGFRGISGAICVDKSYDMIGMLIKKGADLGTHTVNISNGEISRQQMTPMIRSIIMPPYVMLEHINSNKININNLNKN